MAKADSDPEPHQIRLRAAWEHVPSGRRVDLPANWPPEFDSPFQISRRFNRPTLDPARDIVQIRIENVPGLVHATLNDRFIFPDSLLAKQSARLDPSEGIIHRIPIQLAPKNLLVFTIDPSAWRSQPHLAQKWGIVSLLIETLSLDIHSSGPIG